MKRGIRQLWIPGVLVLLPAAFVTAQRSEGPSGARPLGIAVNKMAPLSCADSVRDQATGMCLQATSTPTEGMLFPPPHEGGNNCVQSGTWCFVGGGESNTASESWATVAGGRGNLASGMHAVIAGGWSNLASGDEASVGGGSANDATGLRATVGGGDSNTASSIGSTVAGGVSNDVSSGWSTIGGGSLNVVDSLAGYATIAGGQENTASRSYASVGGGRLNVASGYGSTVPGGLENEATSTFSFAAGHQARANHPGSFVWGDSQDVIKPSSASDQFNVYAEGGVRLFGQGTTDPSLVVDVDGRVGVGTEAPLQGLHVRNLDLGLQASATQSEEVTIEDDVAVLGLHTDGSGVNGSAILLKDVDATGVMTNQWGIHRYGTGNEFLGFSFGTDLDWNANPDIMHIVNTPTGSGVNIFGTLFKTSGAFRIDHPLDPENKVLQHSFVESPDMLNVYNGNVVLGATGEAAVELPEWFEALNRDFRYQLTCIGGFAPVYVAQEIEAGRFRIAGGTEGLKVSWQVTGVRQDPYAEANRIPVEVDKPESERGTYLHPDVYADRATRHP